MKILVTGAAGFIGRNLVTNLRKEGNEVIGIDVIPFNGVIVRDIRSNLSDLMKGIDIVFHEAAITSPPQFEQIPEEGLQVNMIGTFNVLKSAANAGVRKAVVASSSAIYGNIRSPISEENAAEQMENLYPVTKLFDENLAKYFSARKEIEVVSLRYFNTYGIGENSKGSYSSVISRFIENVKLGQSPVIYGDGNQSRDMIYIKDVVKANMLAMKNGKPGDAYNVGTGVTTSFNDVWKIVSEESGADLQPKYVENPFRSYQMYTCANMRKTEAILKFKAEHSIRDGIRDILNNPIMNQ